MSSGRAVPRFTSAAIVSARCFSRRHCMLSEIVRHRLFITAQPVKSRRVGLGTAMAPST
jgi:hypothetical protein